MPRIIVCVKKMADVQQMDFCLGSGLFRSLDRLERRRNNQPTRRNPPLMGGFFDPFPMVFVDANVLVDRFSHAVCSRLFPLIGSICEMFQPRASAFLRPKHQPRTGFPCRDTLIDYVSAHPCLASFLHRRPGGIIFARISVTYSNRNTRRKSPSCAVLQ